ncbi:hypothetical protein NECAME_15652 [Necator americanus]|uniref:Uncharacterized protein n=1 Tax=Necator americanus TaxID=51031 RepID=W2SGW9_NECAM|nr:hypothetical protein NECAME_15652 [Necator americanus]ETN68768.1 hypothetical protein NECAME_15652 [Necator americanus]
MWTSLLFCSSRACNALSAQKLYRCQMQAFVDPPARSCGRGRPRIHANDAERQRSHRTAETRNVREARLIANTQRQRGRRQNEDSAERLL